MSGDLKIYYNVTKNMYGDDFMVFVDGSASALSADRYPSLTMSVDDEGYSVFRWLERSNVTTIDCVDNLKELVLGAVKVAKGLGYTKFALVDDSCVGSSIYSHAYSLSALYFICYGKTLYESIIGTSVEYFSEERMNVYRDRARNLTWSVVSKHLNTLYEPIDVDLTGIDVDAAGSCRSVLLRIVGMGNEAMKVFFYKRLGSVMFAANLPRFHNCYCKLHL
jgi:hypothetical protein